MQRGRAMLVGGLLALSGCVVEATPATGDLSLGWTFVGSDCATGGVATVAVQLFDAAGNTVSTDTLACSRGGITYNALNDGNYHASLDGFASSGARLYQGDANVTVHSGSNHYTVDLQLAQ